MLTLYLILSISLGALKNAFKIIGWIFKWIFILTCVLCIMLPLFLTVLSIMCAASFTIWLIDRIVAKAAGGEPNVKRPPLNLVKNTANLTGAFNKMNRAVERQQSAGNNDMYVVRGNDLVKVTRTTTRKQSITLDEIFLCDVILDE